MTDEQLHRLGEYFVYHRIGDRYGLTFERFVEMNQIGTWAEWMAA